MAKQSNLKNNILLITLSATMGGFLFGFDSAVISGTISLVKMQFILNEMELGWFVSSALLGCIMGVAVSGKLSDIQGRKKVMLFSAILFTISAIGCSASNTITWLIIYRIVGGLGIGMASVICPMYIAELSPYHIRGKLISYYQLAITLGILVAYFSNTLIESFSKEITTDQHWIALMFSQEIWRGMFVVEVLPAILLMSLVFLIPESPRWLAMKGNFKEAENILFGISGEIAKKEIQAIKQSFDNKTVKLKELFGGNLMLPMMIGILLSALSQFSGINAIIYYGPSILETAGFKLSEALGGQVTIGIVNMVFTFVAIYAVDRFGRKPLLMGGITGALVALVGAGVLFALDITNGFAILSCIILFIACFAFSFGPVVWIIVSELFPTHVRARAVAISTMSLWIANWMVGQFFPILNKNPEVPFFVFAICSFFALLLTWKKIPETKGRTLEEIEAYWEH